MLSMASAGHAHSALAKSNLYGSSLRLCSVLSTLTKDTSSELRTQFPFNASGPPVHASTIDSEPLHK